MRICRNRERSSPTDPSTVRDFFLLQSGLSDLHQSLQTNQVFSVQNSILLRHSELTAGCLAYLRLMWNSKTFKVDNVLYDLNHSSNISSWTVFGRCLKGFGIDFGGYATRAWIYHARQCEINDNSGEVLLRDLFETPTS